MIFHSDDDDIKWFSDDETESAPLGTGPLGPDPVPYDNPNS